MEGLPQSERTRMRRLTSRMPIPMNSDPVSVRACVASSCTACPFTRAPPRGIFLQDPPPNSAKDACYQALTSYKGAPNIDDDSTAATTAFHEETMTHPLHTLKAGFIRKVQAVLPLRAVFPHDNAALTLLQNKLDNQRNFTPLLKNTPLLAFLRGYSQPWKR